MITGPHAPVDGHRPGQHKTRHRIAPRHGGQQRAHRGQRARILRGIVAGHRGGKVQHRIHTGQIGGDQMLQRPQMHRDTVILRPLRRGLRRIAQQRAHRMTLRPRPRHHGATKIAARPGNRQSQRAHGIGSGRAQVVCMVCAPVVSPAFWIDSVTSFRCSA